MKGKLIKQEYGYILRKQGFFYASTDHQVIEQLNIEEGPIRHKLSLKNCQAIEFGYDLDELAFDFSWSIQSDPNYGDTINIFREGFQKCLEILGDKKFSDEDMLKSFNRGAFYGRTKLGNTHYFDEFIQSLQQTEWDVEIIEQCLDPTCDGVNRKGECITTGKPKLDADGCLILKRI